MKLNYLFGLLFILLITACGKQASNPVYLTKNDQGNSKEVIIAYNELNDSLSYEVLVNEDYSENRSLSSNSDTDDKQSLKTLDASKTVFRKKILDFFQLKYLEKPQNEEGLASNEQDELLNDAEEEEFASIWQRISNGLELTESSVDFPIVKRHIKQILKHRKSFANATRRAEPFLHMIVEEVERRNLPLELALLPFVESHYHTNAVSPRSKAGGLWQFTRWTGKFYGLEQNWWYDGRFDVYESTHAALDLLEDMYKRYDDWYLALAAYNWGMGNLDRAMRKAGGKNKNNFWTVKLPAETRQYVPKLLAYAYIVRSHQHYDLPIHPIENEPKIATISIDKPYELERLAAAAKVSIHEFRKLNPAHRRWATKPNKTVKMIVPYEHSDQFEVRIKKLKVKSYTYRKYTVRRGDSLYEIALNNGTDVRTLKETNQLRSNIIRIGQKLIIPSQTL